MPPICTRRTDYRRNVIAAQSYGNHSAKRHGKRMRDRQTVCTLLLMRFWRKKPYSGSQTRFARCQFST